MRTQLQQGRGDRQLWWRDLAHSVLRVSPCFSTFFIGMEPSRAFRLLTEPCAVTPGLVLFQVDKKHHFPIYLVMHIKCRLRQVIVCETVIVTLISTKLVLPEWPILLVTYPLAQCFSTVSVVVVFVDCRGERGSGRFLDQLVISRPPRAEAFSLPSAQPVTTQQCVHVCSIWSRLLL